MRKLLVLLLLALSALWLYASWYWYTCIIKGFCSATEVVMVDDRESQSEETISDNSEESVTPVVVQAVPEPVQEEKPVEKEFVEEKASEPREEIVKKECETLIVTSIRLGSENDAGDVKDLEDFLNAFQGESLEVNGIYEQADFDAVKRFQLKHADEILTPWGVQNPTGYVYKTTTKKINDIYCGK